MLDQFDVDAWIEAHTQPAQTGGTEIAAEGSDDEGFDADAFLASMLPAPAPDPLTASIRAELCGEGDAALTAQAWAGDAAPIHLTGALAMV